MVGTSAGYTQPSPASTPFGSIVPAKSLKIWQSAWVSAFGGWPETSEM